MSDPLDLLSKRLKNTGFSITQTRREVFEAMQGQEPLTMAEVVNRCPTADRASVYRVIILFEQLDIVQRLQIGWKYKLELMGEFVHHHHHLTCTQCGRIVPLPEDPTLEKRLSLLAATQDFEPHDHQLEIRGLCANCQAQ